jgi:hypothetical protein
MKINNDLERIGVFLTGYRICEDKSFTTAHSRNTFRYSEHSEKKQYGSRLCEGFLPNPKETAWQPPQTRRNGQSRQASTLLRCRFAIGES